MRDTSSVQFDRVASRSVLLLKSLGGRPRPHSHASFGDVVLPSVVGQVTAGRIRALCLGPSEWLVLASMGEIPLSDAPVGIALADVSHAFASLVVQGPDTETLLAKGCGLDMDPRFFVVGTCARTRFARLAVIMYRDDTSRFELLFARSYLEYLQDWLADAAAERMHVTPR